MRHIIISILILLTLIGCSNENESSLSVEEWNSVFNSTFWMAPHTPTEKLVLSRMLDNVESRAHLEDIYMAYPDLGIYDIEDSILTIINTREDVYITSDLLNLEGIPLMSEVSDFDGSVVRYTEPLAINDSIWFCMLTVYGKEQPIQAFIPFLTKKDAEFSLYAYYDYQDDMVRVSVPLDNKQ